MANLVVHDRNELDSSNSRYNRESFGMLPGLKYELSMPGDTISNASKWSQGILLGSVSTKLLGSNIRGVAVVILDFWRKDLTSHYVDGFFTKQVERFRHSDGRHAIGSRESNILHSMDMLGFLICQMNVWFEQVANGLRATISGKILCEGAL